MLHNQESHQQDKQMQILRFMEATQCQSYEQAEVYIEKNQMILQNAIHSYFIQRKDQMKNIRDKGKVRRNITNNNLLIEKNQINVAQDTILPNLTPEELYLLEKQLRQKSRSTQTYHNNKVNRNKQNKNCFKKLFQYCRNSFKCFKAIKKTFYKKLKLNKDESQKIHEFNEIYYEELQRANINIEQLKEIYQIRNIQQSHKQKIEKKQVFKPIFVLITANRKNSLIVNLLNNKLVMDFLRQHFEIFFMTLSELKDLQLNNRHQLRRISKCPITLIYSKSYINTEDVLQRFQGQAIKQITIVHLQNALDKHAQIFKKWSLVMNLQEQLLRNLSLQSEFQYYQDYEQLQQDDFQNSGIITLPFEEQSNKTSLIQEQTRIYEQMLTQQSKRKESIQQQKRRYQQMKQQRQVRRLSLPSEPVGNELVNSTQFKFRCPLNGQYIVRRFLNNQKVDILYQFVDINDDIQFESDPQRKFELFMSFPPICLSDKRNLYLSQVFDQQKQNILIREI